MQPDHLPPDGRTALEEAGTNLIAAEAEAAYQAALRLDAKSAPVLVNLADLYRAAKENTRAEPLLRQATADQPSYAPAYHALGLLMVRLHELPEALIALEKAAAQAPQEARYGYVYAIALNSSGRAQDALAILKQANLRHPADTDILTALSTISRDIGDRAGALTYAQQLVAVAPNNREARSLLDSLQRH